MNKESYVDSLRDEFGEEVTAVIRECHFVAQTHLCFELLNKTLNSKSFAQRKEKLTPDEWYELVYELTPDVYDDMNFGILAA